MSDTRTRACHNSSCRAARVYISGAVRALYALRCNAARGCEKRHCTALALYAALPATYRDFVTVGATACRRRLTCCVSAFLLLAAFARVWRGLARRACSPLYRCAYNRVAFSVVAVNGDGDDATRQAYGNYARCSCWFNDDQQRTTILLSIIGVCRAARIAWRNALLLPPLLPVFSLPRMRGCYVD